MFDPISDMLTRIRNAQSANKRDAVMPFSKIKMAMAQILEREKFIELAQKEKLENHENIRLTLKYEKISNTQKNPAISGIERVSHVGQRAYVKKGDIKGVKNGYGISIISTSKGLMTGREAKKLGLGGEFICRVW